MLTATAGTARDEVLSAFGPRLAQSPEVLERLVSYTKIFNVAAEDLHAKWEAYTLTPAAQRDDDDLSVPTLAHLDDLQTELLRKQQAAKQEAVLGNADSLLNVRDVNPFTEGKMFTNDSLQNLFSEGGQDKLGGFRTPAKVKRKVVPKDASTYSAGRFSASKGTPGGLSTPKTPVSMRFRPGDISPGSPLTPMRGMGERTTPVASPNAKVFADRLNKNKTEETLNDQVPLQKSKPDDAVPCEITLLPGQQTGGYRYMYERLMERGDYLDDRINTFADLITEAVQSRVKEEDRTDVHVQHPGNPSQDTLFTVGRVCCDAVVEKAKLNDQSVVLEASRAIGAGDRVKINLREMPGYALFPGQIIGLEGMNASGRLINATKLYQPQLPPKATTTPSQLAALYPEDNPASERPVNVFIANGPYTLDDSLQYEPFEELVVEIEKEMPDVVILQGPFVDANHPMIEAGNVDMELDELFRVCIAPRVTRILQARKDNIKVIMIPSTRDACSEWVSFPQPSLAAGLDERAALERRRILGIPGEVMLFPNPVQFTVNEVVFACCSTDVLWQIAAEELARVPRPDAQHSGDPIPGHKISRLFRHMMSQRSFYPLFPPALDDACLDLSRSAALELQATPDVLVVGSRLQYTARKVEGCLCINPGLLVKGRAGGTFAKMCIWPLDMARVRDMVKQRDADAMDVDGQQVEEDAIANALDERCRVEIQRI